MGHVYIPLTFKKKINVNLNHVFNRKAKHWVIFASGFRSILLILDDKGLRNYLVLLLLFMVCR